VILYSYSGGVVSGVAAINVGGVSQAGFVVNAGGSPTLARAWVPGSIADGAPPPTSPYSLTRNAAGDYSIGWLGLPGIGVVAFAPRVSLAVTLGVHVYAAGGLYTGSPITGVHVTTTIDGVLADLNFAVELL